MTEFTYRSARVWSITVAIAVVIAVESAGLHLALHAGHPLVAWISTTAGASTLIWLARDVYALGRGAIRLDSGILDLRVGRRARAQVPLALVETIVTPTWRDIPAPGAADGSDYRNLMKPATPNVLLTLTQPIGVRFFGAITRPARRLGLRVDDPSAFIQAVETARTRPAG